MNAGTFFHKLREKLLLTPDDVQERCAFSKKYRKKKAAWWIHRIHVHLDNKCFKVATTARGRRIWAMRNVRGAYRARKRSLQPEHVKATRKLRQNTGDKGVLVGGGVSAQKTQIIDETWGSFLTKSISDLPRRCEILFEVKGGLFEEGERAPRARRPC